MIDAHGGWQSPSTVTNDAALVMVIDLARGGHALRLTLTRRITSIGSDESADVRLPTAPEHWAVVHRADAAIDVLIASTGQRHRLEPGQSLEVDGSGSRSSRWPRCASASAIEELVSALAAVEAPERAVELLLAGLIGASGADLSFRFMICGPSWAARARPLRIGSLGRPPSHGSPTTIPPRRSSVIAAPWASGGGFSVGIRQRLIERQFTFVMRTLTQVGDSGLPRWPGSAQLLKR